MLSRLDLLEKDGMGLGPLGLINAAHASKYNMKPKLAQMTLKVKRVVHIFLNRELVHVDSFDLNREFDHFYRKRSCIKYKTERKT